MTSKILKGRYAAGYSLSPVYSAVKVKASAYIGGQGLLISSAAKVVNAGTIESGNSGSYGASGYVGVYMKYGSPIGNSGVIIGGAGAAGVGGDSPKAGGRGGVGVRVRGYGSLATVITNTHDIFGGAGGAGGDNGSDISIPAGAGGAGGAGVSITGYGSLANTVVNKGSIVGGSGGAGGNGGIAGEAGDGGGGGAGVVMLGAGRVTLTAGSIAGGLGGGAGGTGHGQDFSTGGAGGAGVRLFNGAGLMVSGGTLVGGVGGSRYGTGGAGGAGAYLYGGAVTVSGGGVYGGVGGKGGQVVGAGGYANGGNGGAAILLDGVGDHLTQAGGVIAGGAGGAGPLSDYYLDGRGGAGGSGIQALQSTSVTQTSGTIEGATGGVYDGRGATGGAGGIGVYLGGGGQIVCGGEIIGGAGGHGAYGGDGGSGVTTRLAATVTNTGTILGGAAGGGTTFAGAAGNGVALSYAGGTVTNGSAKIQSALIEGAFGVDVAPYGGLGTTVTNFGTIEGTGGFSVFFGSHGDVAADRVIAEAGSVWIGDVAGGGGTLELAGGAETVAGLGAGGSLAGSVAMDFSGFGSYQVDKATALTLIGSDTLVSGATFTDKGKLTSTGVLGVSGTVIGAGSLTIGAGVATIGAGARLTVSTWTLSGGTTDIDETLTYAETFAEAAGATMTLASGDKVSLSGVSILAGLVNGGGSLTAANTTLEALTIGGTATLGITGTATQTGQITVGDSSANAATLSIAKAATLTITTASDIDQGAAAGSSLNILGTLVRSGAAGTSTVQVAITNSGLIEAEDGTLDFRNALGGTGALSIATGATLEVDSTTTSTLKLTFTGTGAILALKAPTTFGASIAGFTSGNDIDLLAIKATTAVLGAGDTLVITNGTKAVATLQLAGNYAADTFGVATDGHGGSLVTVSTGANSPTAAAPGSVLPFVAAMAGMSAGGAAANMSLAHARSDLPSMLVEPRTQMA